MGNVVGNSWGFYFRTEKKSSVFYLFDMYMICSCSEITHTHTHTYVSFLVVTLAITFEFLSCKIKCIYHTRRGN